MLWNTLIILFVNMYENKWSIMQHQYIYMYCYIWHAQCLSDRKNVYMDYISCGENCKFYLSLLLVLFINDSWYILLKFWWSCSDECFPKMVHVCWSIYTYMYIGRYAIWIVGCWESPAFIVCHTYCTKYGVMPMFPQPYCMFPQCLTFFLNPN